MFESLEAVGVGMVREMAETGQGAFAGKRIVITGTLEAFTRGDLTAQLETLGATVSGSVAARSCSSFGSA